MICGNCGFRNDPGDQFCGNCGRFLEWTAKPEDPGETGAGSADETAVVETPTGAVAVAGGTASGAGASAASGHQTIATPAPAGPGEVICGNCGRSNPSNRTFCLKCGTRLAAMKAAPTLVTAGSVRAASPSGSEAPSGRGNRRLLAIGGGLIAALVIAVVAVGLLGGAGIGSSASELVAAASQSPSAVGTVFASPDSTAASTPGLVVSTITPTAVTPTTNPTPRPTAQAPSPTRAPTPRPTPSGPSIASYTVPASVDCSGVFVAYPEISWVVNDGTAVFIGIDGPGYYNSDPFPTTYTVNSAGKEELPFACGSATHDYWLTAIDANGKTVQQTKSISAAP